MGTIVKVDDIKLQRIKTIENEVEPSIIEIIKGSNESNCPYKVLRGGDLDSKEVQDGVTKMATLFQKHGILNKLDLTLSDDQAFDTLLYAFGYWGGKTLYKHGNKICRCRSKCY